MVTPSGVYVPNLTTERRRVRPAAVLVIAAVLAAVPAGLVSAQFSSSVNLVEVYASVTDRQGQPVKGLTREDFTVREDGAVQQVTAFTAGEFPLSVAVALDRSFSMSGQRLAAARSAARLFFDELKPTDESMLIGIGSTTEVLAPLSTDRARQFEVLSRLDAFGTTGLYDAIVAAIDAIQPARGRRALVLLSDGSDRYSTATSAEALARARTADVLVYPIALGETRPPVFAELATLTGARSFHVRDGRQLPETLRTVAAELRHQYLLGYSPSKPPVGGSNQWRSIDVTVGRTDVTVRARDGYLVK
jgi:Ca-activated chloride channel family protein